MGFDIAGHERQTCRKFFQFQVSKPIDVKTKSYYTEVIINNYMIIIMC